MGYGNEEWSTFEVECGSGAKGKAMVWDNRHLVHRVRMLKNLNNDTKIRKKGYLAFFVVDPDNELERTTENTPMVCRDHFIEMLQKMLRKRHGLPGFTEDLSMLIAEYAEL